MKKKNPYLGNHIQAAENQRQSRRELEETILSMGEKQVRTVG